jgi:DNA repair exonuclease SbcCD ATPase subunit
LTIPEIETKLIELEQGVAVKERQLSDRIQDLARLEDEYATLSKDADILEKVEATLQAVSARVLNQSTDTIDKLVTAGLKAVFYDQKLEFKTVVDKYRGKTSMKFELYHNGKSAPLLDSYGGGVLVLCGVLLRVVTIIVLKQKRFLALDESLSHLSVQYHENASALLQKICKELGFSILMITHQEGFVRHANTHYEAKETKEGVTFELVKKP